MTDREKLIEILSEKISEYCRLSVIAGTTKITGVTLDAYRLADHLITNGVTFAKDTNVHSWIPVSERLPDKFGEYIVAIKTVSGQVYSDYADYDLFGKRWTTGLYFEIGSKVTHWMPLPSTEGLK